MSSSSQTVPLTSCVRELDGKFPDLVQVLHLHAEHQAGHVTGVDEEGRNVGHLGGPA